MDKFHEKLGLCWESPGKKEMKKINRRRCRRRLKEELNRSLRKDREAA